MAWEQAVKQAIAGRLVIEMEYEGGGARVVDPHGLFEDHEKCRLLRVWQVDGFSESGNVPGWRTFKIEGVSGVWPLHAHFVPRPDHRAALQELNVGKVLAWVE